MKRNNLILVTELRHGYRDMLTNNATVPHLVVYDRPAMVAIKIVDLPDWVNPRDERTIPAFLKGFSKMYEDALLYLLEDSKEIEPGHFLPECTFKHLTQLADFLKETI